MALPWIKVSTLPSTGQSLGYKDDCYLVLAFKGIRDRQEKAACTRPEMFRVYICNWHTCGWTREKGLIESFWERHGALP